MLKLGLGSRIRISRCSFKGGRPCTLDFPGALIESMAVGGDLSGSRVCVCVLVEGSVVVGRS